MRELGKEIEVARGKLVNLAAEYGYDFHNAEIQRMSKELDRLIVAYYNSKYEKINQSLALQKNCWEKLL